ncbi:hypothetical protein FKM82_018268 [Ascaphus truei]|uniref:large ribosomal subunit protein mL64 n=1 Tax=Ascaphus truei TaxID=8439 RepID=UPI003F599630
MAAPMHRCWALLRSLTLSLPAAGYHAKPRIWGLSGVYKPDPRDPETKEWHIGPKFEAKLYGKHGEASQVDPEALWPRPEKLRELEEEEREWYPSLGDMLERVEAKDRELAKKKEERERLIASNLAKMPKMVADWRRDKREAKQKLREEQIRRDRLVAKAREKFGVSMDPRSVKFQELVKELEKEDKKNQKALKKRTEAAGVGAKAGNAPAAGSP